MKMLTTIIISLIIMHVSAPPFHCSGDRIRRHEITMRDAEVQKIMKVIRMIESSGNYNAIGGSGEIGAYQFLPETWNRMSRYYFGGVLRIEVPENQDLIAEMKVKSLLDAGYSISEIASIWNSGRPVWEGRIGVNRWGQKYNTPRYVRRFNKLYLKL